MNVKAVAAALAAFAQTSRDRQDGRRIRTNHSNPTSLIFIRLSAMASFLLLFAVLPAIPSVASGYPPSRIVAVESGCNLAAPASFSAQSTGINSVLLNWSTVSGAVAYRLTIYEGSTNNPYSTSTEYGTSKALSGLTIGETYRCVLASVCPDGSTSDFIIVVEVLV